AGRDARIIDLDFALLERLKPDVDFVRMENRTLDQLREGIIAMGEAVGREDLSSALLARMDAALDAVAEAVADRPRRRVLLLQGYRRPSTTGAGWLTDELITIAGGANVAAEAGLSSWATINLETIRALQPEVIICLVGGGEGDRVRARVFWARRRELRAVRTGRVVITDDQRLTIPGSRVARTAECLARMIHPEAFEEDPADG
ncbi:MAG: ABC transporter substrate-binding protein, partial [Planctomycetota bacterium]